MCGIAGFTGQRDHGRLQAMLDAIAHRGPDDQGQVWVTAGHDESVGLGNRRLSILDPSSAGHQPMVANGSVLAYNGEVYNFKSLRKELEGRGTRFVSGTDTEVVLALLRQEGTSGLSRLNGMFALAFWDAERCELVLARDRFGVKPLYYRWRNMQLAFGSEAKCLFAAGATAELNIAALGAYLRFGWVPGPETMYQDVVELSPGHLLRWCPGSVQIESYRDVMPQPRADMDEAEAALALREKLTDAVRRQMVADVPVGVLLSGGLDSSAIAALAAAESHQPVRAYTIGFRAEDAKLEQSSDDARCARLVARHFGLKLEEFVVTPDIAGLLEDAVRHLDDPVADPAAILTLIISRAAACDVKVLLSGQGADELFGGYRVHVFDRIARQLERQPGWSKRVLIKGVNTIPLIADHAPGNVPGVLMGAHRASRSVLDNLSQSPEDRYIAFRSAYYFQVESLRALLRPEVSAEVLGAPADRFHRKTLTHAREAGLFDRMLYLDFKTFLVNQNLAYSDRLSMAASVEMRVPFLDDAVADLALRVPERLKIRGYRGKYLLRQSMRDLLPPEVISRRKAGFGAPIRSWLRFELLPTLHESLSDHWLDATALFDKQAVRSLIAEHAAGTHDHTYRLWTLLTFAAWHRLHLGSGSL